MGLHCGLRDSSVEIQYNQASARYTFSGETLAMTKAVGDTANGGQVVLSQEVHMR